MANSQTGFGFRMLGRQDGAPATFGTRLYPIDATNTTTIGRGCTVALDTTGYIRLATTGDSVFLGVFDGGYKTDTSLPQRYTQFSGYFYSATAVSGSVYGYVIDDPNAEFEVRVSGGPLTIADVGANATFIAGTVNTNTGFSTDLLNATVTTSTTAPYRIVGLSGRVGNDNASSYNIVNVKLNSANLSSTTGIVS